MDLSSLSDEEILQAAGVSGGSDLSSVSDKDILEAAGYAVVPPSLSSTASYVGKAFAEGGARTTDFVTNLGKAIFKPTLDEKLNSIFSVLSGKEPTPAQDVIKTLIGTPEDTGITGGAGLNIIKSGVEATAFPGGPVTNFLVGLGAGAGHEVAPNSAIAPLIGGAAAVLAPQVAKSGINSLIDAFSSAAKTQAAEKSAFDIIKNITNINEALTSLKEAREAEALVPVIQKESSAYLPQYQRTAEITNSPGIAALEKQVADTVPKAKEAMALQDVAREEGRQSLFSSLNKFPKTPEQYGNDIRAGLEANNLAIGEKVSNLADRAFVGGEKLKSFPAKRAVSDALNVLTGDKARTVSSDFQNLIDNFRNLPPRVDLQTLQNYRSAFGEFARASGNPMASTVERQTASIASSMRSALDTSIENSIASGQLPKAQANAWKNMIATRAKQGELFQSGVTGDILEKAPFSSAEAPKYAMESSKVGSAGINSVQDARQLITALRGQSDSIQAVRGSLLSKIWQKSTNPTTGNFVPSSFNRQLRLISGIDQEILTPSQVKALSKIGDDFASQGQVAQNAFMASRGNSITAERGSMIDLIQGAVKEGATGIVRQSIAKIPVLGKAIDSLVNIVSNPVERQNLINQKLAQFVTEPVYAEALLSKDFNVAAPVLSKFGEVLQASLPAAVNATNNLPENNQFLPSDNQVQQKPSSVLFDENGNPTQLALDAIKQVESSGNPNAIGPVIEAGSHKGERAKGAYQFLDSTAKQYGIDPFDEESARQGAFELLRDNYSATNDPFAAIAAYNRGVGNIKQDISSGRGIQNLEYVFKVLKAAGL